ncbi:unnamed protein product [Urochloa humidicola]
MPMRQRIAVAPSRVISGVLRQLRPRAAAVPPPQWHQADRARWRGGPTRALRSMMIVSPPHFEGATTGRI